MAISASLDAIRGFQALISLNLWLDVTMVILCLLRLSDMRAYRVDDEKSLWASAPRSSRTISGVELIFLMISNSVSPELLKVLRILARRVGTVIHEKHPLG